MCFLLGKGRGTTRDRGGRRGVGPDAKSILFEQQYSASQRVCGGRHWRQRLLILLLQVR